MIQERRKLRRDVTAPQLERWRTVGLRQDGDFRLLHLDARGRLFADHRHAGDLDHRFRWQLPHLATIGVGGDHHLGNTGAVAEKQEGHLRELPLMMEPTGEVDRFAGVLRELRGPDPFHPHLHLGPGPRCAGEGDLAVPPHFAAVVTATSLTSRRFRGRHSPSTPPTPTVEIPGVGRS